MSDGTLTGYEATGHAVATNTKDDHGYADESEVLTITSSSNNIKYFTIATDDGGNNAGLGLGKRRLELRQNDKHARKRLR